MRDSTAVSLERIEKMLLICAELVDRRGPIAQPLLDRMEREYLAAKTRGSELERVRRLIAEATDRDQPQSNLGELTVDTGRELTFVEKYNEVLRQMTEGEIGQLEGTQLLVNLLDQHQMDEPIEPEYEVEEPAL